MKRCFANLDLVSDSFVPLVVELRQLKLILPMVVPLLLLQLQCVVLSETCEAGRGIPLLLGLNLVSRCLLFLNPHVPLEVFIFNFFLVLPHLIQHPSPCDLLPLVNGGLPLLGQLRILLAIRPALL